MRKEMAYGKVVPIDGEGKDVSHGLVDNAKTMGEARSDSSDCPRHLRTTVVTTHTVDGPSIRDTIHNILDGDEEDGGIEWHIRYNTGGDIAF